MRHIFHDLRALPPAARGTILALGNFDGVHKGHQAVLASARARAEELGVPVGALTFEPHPRTHFAPHQPPFRLTSPETKARLLRQYGADYVFALPFGDIAPLSAQDFVLDILVSRLQAVEVLVGADFRFGKGRAGDIAVLGYMGVMEGVDVTIVPPEKEGGEVVSSSRIRALLEDGRPDSAADLLGHVWQIEGIVQEGDQRGRTIGFPTANLPLTGYMTPKLGVYAVAVEVCGGRYKGRYEGVANIGRKPTFGEHDAGLEVHLLDFQGDLYGARLVVSLLDFIRPEQAFSGIDALKAQIAADVDRARSLHGLAPLMEAANGACG